MKVCLEDLEEQEKIVQAQIARPGADLDSFFVKCTVVREILIFFYDLNESIETVSSDNFSNEDLSRKELIKKATSINKRLYRQQVYSRDHLKKRVNMETQGILDKRAKFNRREKIKMIAKECLVDPRLHYLVFCDMALSLLKVKSKSRKDIKNSKLVSELQQYIDDRKKNKIFKLFLTAEMGQLEKWDKDLKELLLIAESKADEDLNNENPGTFIASDNK